MAKKAARKTAKKTTKKAARKPAKKSAKKSAKKAAKKNAAKAANKAGKKPGKKAARKTTKKSARKPAAQLLKPKRVTSGRGRTPAELGKIVVDHVNAMAVSDMELWRNYFHPKFISIEGDGQAWSGRKAVDAKCRAWMDAHTVYACRATGPFAGATGFSVVYDMEIEAKDGSFPRMQMREVGVYTVKNGKIVQEEFMYAGM
ncbi:MAG: nuclear transport factor 2 family protein [Phycisphaerales bacterium]|nr:nuclear transport factor 2 family protein [Planctomycetota bacterium]MCH8507994.1 nuclear transport factor 2 family protein [Phycisphaerales bacterium]